MAHNLGLTIAKAVQGQLAARDQVRKPANFRFRRSCPRARWPRRALAGASGDARRNACGFADGAPALVAQDSSVKTGTCAKGIALICGTAGSERRSRCIPKNPILA